MGVYWLKGGLIMSENKYAELAAQFVQAVKTISSKPENLDNLECYLSHCFRAWLEKYANTPETLTSEMIEFANMII